MEMIRTDHKIFISPLSDWRILDIKGMMECSQFERFKNYDYAKKLLQKMKAQKLVNVYRCVFNRKNYYYLTPLAEKLINPDQKSSLSDETLFHDAMVSALAIELSKIKPFIEEIELEHIIKNGRARTNFDEIIPDARLKGNFNDKNFVSAIEIEIHQKEKSRIIAKAKNYLKASYYDYAFYFFPDERILKNYAKVLRNEFGNEFNNKIFLFSCPKIFEGKNTLSEGNGIVKGDQKNILELFGIVPHVSPR